MQQGRLTLAVLMAVFAPHLAQAEVKTWVATGVVSGVSDGAGLLPYVHPGDRVTYAFSFDTQTPDTDPNPYLGYYAGISSSLTIAARVVEVGVPKFEVQHPPDYFGVSSPLGLTPVGATSGFGISLQWPNQPFSSTSLPSAPYDIHSFQMHEFGMAYTLPPAWPGGPRPYSEAWGQIDGLYEVPEPGTAALMVGSMLVIHARPRRRGHCGMRSSRSVFGLVS